MQIPRIYTYRRKISPENEAYLKRIEAVQDDIGLEDHIHEIMPFGLKAVFCRIELRRRVQQLENDTTGSPEQKQRAIQFLEDSYRSEARKSMSAFVQRVEHRKENVQHVLQYMLEDEKIQQALEPLVRPIRQVDKSLYGTLKPEEILLRSIFSSVSVDFANRVYTLIKRKRIPLEIWTDMLERHNKEFIRRQKLFRETLLPRLKENLLARVRHVHETKNDYLLPPVEVVHRKLERLIIDIQDGIEAKFDDRSGAYWSSNKRVLLDSDLVGEESFINLEDVFVHEMNHALSGHTIVENDHSMLSQILGTEVILDGSIQIGFRRQGVFRWMNEGFTELMTSYITGRPPTSYSAEVALCQYVANEGKNIIPLTVFADAYYEDYDPTQKPTIPKWRALRQAINESFSPAFLTKLTKIIMVAGPKVALHMLENEGVEGFL